MRHPHLTEDAHGRGKAMRSAQPPDHGPAGAPVILPTAEVGVGGSASKVIDVGHFGCVQTKSSFAGAQREIEIKSPSVAPEGGQIHSADSIPAAPGHHQ